MSRSACSIPLWMRFQSRTPKNSFQTLEYVQLGLGKDQKYYPLERLDITFYENGTYTIKSDLVFKPPQYDRKTLFHILNANQAVLKKIKAGKILSQHEYDDLVHLPDTSLICYLNGFDEAKDLMEEARGIFKKDRPFCI